MSYSQPTFLGILLSTVEDEEESDNESIAAHSDDEEEIKTMHLKKRKRVVEPGADAR